MRALVTGGTGFVGSRLAHACLADGLEVRVFAQVNDEAQREHKEQLETAGAEVVVGSVTDADARREICRDVAIVFHLAAAQHEVNIPDRVFWNVNTYATEALLAEAKRASVGRFVYASTIGVYGDVDYVLNEASPTNPSTAYGASKLAAEGHVLAAAQALPAAVIRISETYGPGDRRLLKLFKLIERGAFVMVGSGANLHHLIYIDDLVEVLLLAARSPDAVGQICIAAGPEPVTTREMVASVAAAQGKRAPKRSIPLLPVLGLAVLMEAGLRPLGVQPPLHRRRLDFFRRSFAFSTAKMVKTLGFAPRTGLADGIERTAAWYRQTGLL